MGAWGTGIFDDDVALDVRNTFEAALREGLTVAGATRRVLEEYADHLEDEDDRPVVQLALGALQVQHRALQPEVRRDALAVIDQGRGLQRWEEAGEGMLVERMRALGDLKGRLQAAPAWGGE